MSLGFTAGAAANERNHQKRHQSSAIALLSVGPDAVTGHVSSDEKPCRVQRQVTISRPNTESSVPSGELVARTWTRGDGSWAVPGPLFPSEFFAVAEQKSAKGIVCDPVTSNTLVWG